MYKKSTFISVFSFGHLLGVAEMTSNIEEFIRNPPEDLLNEFWNHYNVGLSVADLKESLMDLL